MRWVPSLSALFTPVALVAAALLLPSTAAAKLAATVTVEPSGSGSRLVVVLSSDAALTGSKRPAKLAIKAKGKTYKLTKAKAARAAVSLGTWRSSVLKGKAQSRAQRLVGRKVSVVVTAKSGATKTVKSVAGLPVTAGQTTPAIGTAPGATTPAPGGTTPTPSGPTPTSLFGTPAAALEGQAAATAILPYLLDSRFTDCPARWPNCFTAHHFSQLTNGDFYYCRLTSAQGADIKSYASNLTVTGASQATDGSWSVSYAVLSYGNVVNYRWDVTPQGAATGQYWSTATVSPGQAPDETYTGYVWVRGALDCSY